MLWLISVYRSYIKSQQDCSQSSTVMHGCEQAGVPLHRRATGFLESMSNGFFSLGINYKPQGKHKNVTPWAAAKVRWWCRSVKLTVEGEFFSCVTLPECDRMAALKLWVLSCPTSPSDLDFNICQEKQNILILNFRVSQWTRVSESKFTFYRRAAHKPPQHFDSWLLRSITTHFNI